MHPFRLAVGINSKVEGVLAVGAAGRAVRLYELRIFKLSFHLNPDQSQKTGEKWIAGCGEKSATTI